MFEDRNGNTCIHKRQNGQRGQRGRGCTHVLHIVVVRELNTRPREEGVWGWGLMEAKTVRVYNTKEALALKSAVHSSQVRAGQVA